MADTKISGLPNDVVTLADGDKFPIAQASALTSDVFTTGLEIKTFNTNAPLFAAGSTSANSKPKLTSGTNLTTPEVGAVEFGDESLFFTPSSGSRNKVYHRHFIRTGTAFTLSNTTSSQALFASPNTLTLTLGNYQFNGLIQVTGMSVTTGNALINLLGAGTAVASNQLINCIGLDASNPLTPGTQTGTWTSGSLTTPASCVTAGPGTTLYAKLNGYFTVTTAGTLIPSISLVTAIGTATVFVNSYINIERIGASSVANIGNWS